MHVELTGEAGISAVPPGVGVCAYRIVQESLSNASQHAPSTAVTVPVEHDASAVQLVVANGPAAACTGQPGRASESAAAATA